VVDLLAPMRNRRSNLSGPLIFVLVLIATGPAGCGLFRKEGTGPETRAGTPRDERGATSPGEEAGTEGGLTTERTGVAAPGDRRQPARGDAGADTPRRRASQRLVEEGKGYFIAGQNGEARERFQQAIRLDGSNGAAYYYLAEIAADEGEWDDAAGYREQAGALLRGREEYRQPLDDLAGRIADRR
jgi:tetratricopeptide (TPR) repeat protein